jgi:oxygen-independent coproporphyrinogen III oxidase
VALARAAGFSQHRLDVIYGVPGVSREAFCADVEAALALDPEHVSGYCLEIEDGTPLAREAAAGRLAVAEDEQRAQFDWARRRLAAAGFVHYEISNFAKPGPRMPAESPVLDGRGLYRPGTGGAFALGRRSVGPHGGSAGVEAGVRGAAGSRGQGARNAGDGLAAARRVGARRVPHGDGLGSRRLRGPEIARLVAEGRLVAEAGRVRLADDALFVSDAVFAELV